jgi:two-component system invasion response regulator UvrY
MTIRVVIVDDHALIRRGLRESLTEAGDVAVVGEAADEAGLRGLLREVECDVLLLDINLPGRSGLDALAALAVEPRRPRVLADPATIVAAVRTLHAGRKYITPAIAEALAERLTADPDTTPHERLSEREFQTMTRLATGQRLSDIAAELHLSPKTVSVYRSRVLEKLGMHSNAELTAYCLRNGLID